MQPEISVIIPVHNGAAFIGRAIDSVLRQTLPPVDIVVVNDGSIDGTLEALAPYRQRIRVITTPNRGVSSARNTGIAASRAPLVAFLDADDVWHDEKLERQAASLAACPDAALCCCDYIPGHPAAQARSQFERIRCRSGTQAEDWARQPLLHLLRENFIGTTSTVMLRRSVLDRVGGFDPGYRQAEDFDLWLRCALHRTFAVLPEVLLTKVEHGTNLTRNQLEMVQCHERVLVAFARSHGLPTSGPTLDACRSGLADTRFMLANLLFEARRHRDSARMCWLALRTDPTSRNLLRFAGQATRKLARFLSCGALRRRPIATTTAPAAARRDHF